MVGNWHIVGTHQNSVFEKYEKSGKSQGKSQKSQDIHLYLPKSQDIHLYLPRKKSGHPSLFTDNRSNDPEITCQVTEIYGSFVTVMALAINSVIV